MGAAKCEYCGAAVSAPYESRAAESEAARERDAAPALRFKKVSVGLMAVFAVITLGLYLSVWFFVRRGRFAELSPKAKNAGFLFGGLLGVHIFYALGIFGYLGSPDGELYSVVQVLGWMLMGVMIYSAVIARSALADFAASRGRGPDFAGSAAWAAVLNALYLQSQINRMVDARVLNAAS
jgi:predicted permease